MPYPAAFDSTFPGYPYTDNTQFIDETQANAWVQAIQNIEATIGYPGQAVYATSGSSVVTNPLYSPTYGSFNTLTARIASLETTVKNGIAINQSNGNIQSVGSSNQAGSTGLAADAGHVHEGAITGLVPIGTVIMWAGTNNAWPGGWWACNGQPISISTYNNLYTVLGSGAIYGTSGGNFFLPNFNDRFPVGVSSTAATVGATGGSRAISQGQLPPHSHPAPTDAGHIHQISNPFGGGGFQPMYGQIGFTGAWAAAGNGSQYGPGGLGINTDSVVQTAVGYASLSATGNTGNGSNYDQPYLGVYFLIYGPS